MIEISLQELDGQNGFTVQPLDSRDSFSGSNLAALGDFNGDGIDDFAAGADLEDQPGRFNAGTTRVIFGSDEPFSPVIDVEPLAPGAGTTIVGAEPSDRSAITLSTAGDVNNDGLADLLIGAEQVDLPGQDDVGAAYLIYGSATPPTSIDLANLTNGVGTVFTGLEAGDFTGWALGDAGDFNGDGVDDILIDAHRSSPEGRAIAGSIYVVFGRDGGFGEAVDLAELDGSNGLRINGVAARDFTGKSIDGAGDFNGDGFDDIVIGAIYANTAAGGSSGRAYVVFGSDQPFPSILELSGLNGATGFAIPGLAPNDRLGKHVRGIGDLNDDGLDDIMLGVQLADADGKRDAGTAYVLYGTESPFAPTFDLASIDGSNGFALIGSNPNDQFAFSFDSAGDFNADGIADIVVGGPLVDIDGKVDAGQAFVLYGSGSGFPSQLRSGDLPTFDGLLINGLSAGDETGRAVTGGADINDDGASDVIVGSLSASQAAYAIFGDPSADNGPPQGAQVIAEFGTIDINHTRTVVTLDNTYVNPVVIALAPSFNGSQEVSVRFTEIANDSFTVRLDEPSNRDELHVLETVSYLVVEAGTWQLADGTKLQAGTTITDNTPLNGFEPVAFEKSFDAAPVVLTQLQTFNGGDFSNARKQGVTKDGFLVAIEEEEALNVLGFHVNEEIGWVAIEEGSGSWSGARYLADIQDRSANSADSFLSFGSAFTAAPDVFAQARSYRGADPISTRYKTVTEDGVTVRLQEDQTLDAERNHTIEDMDIFALQGPSGELSAALWV